MSRRSASRLRARGRRLGRGLVRVFRLRPSEWLTTMHVLVLISVIEALIRWVPLPRLARMLGVRVNLGPARSDVELFPESALTGRAARQLRCTRRVAGVWPFSRGPCLRQSLVAGHLLRHHHPTLRLGMVDGDASFLAHAWIEIADQPLEPIDGYSVFQRLPARIAE